jgi:ComF family protein
MLARLVQSFLAPLCVACGADTGRGGPLCRGCRAELARSRAPELEAAWAVFRYDGPAGALVRELKFGGQTALADVMAGQIAAHAPPGLLAGALVPVPLHPARLRRRGFNHAAALAAALARRTGLPVADCLRRSGDPAPQAGRGRRARMHALTGRVTAEGPVPARALIVDDVVTTGATLRACSEALKEAGCAQVGGLTYARTPGR